jgi:hypothetical protein
MVFLVSRRNLISLELNLLEVAWRAKKKPKPVTSVATQPFFNTLLLYFRCLHFKIIVDNNLLIFKFIFNYNIFFLVFI